jgi:hypothetical protein
MSETEFVQIPRDTLRRLQILHSREASTIFGTGLPERYRMLAPQLYDDGPIISAALSEPGPYNFPPSRKEPANKARRP